VDLFVAASNLLFIAAGSAVGVRLLARARRLRAFPEEALGTGLVSFAGVAQPCTIAGSLAGASHPEWKAAFSIATAVFSALAVVAVFAFTWRVFRPRERWALGLAGAGSALAIAAAIGLVRLAFVRLDPAHATAPSASWVALMTVGFALAFGWTSAESLSYWERLRRRVRVGLGDAVVANRFALWGTGCAIGFAIELGLAGLAIGGASFSTNALPRLLISVTGLVNAAVWFLSFTPPAAYARWIERRAAAAARASS
jgi:hypothetical protein